MTEFPNPGLVPRETLPALEAFVDLLNRWNGRINLVSRAGTDGVWRRHILDSAQLAAIAPAAAATWLDLGSGAGFPGLICAAVLAAKGSPTRITLVEADGRKASFLREAANRMKLDVTVLHRRIEDTALPPQDVISARALAPLEPLVGYAAPFRHGATVMLFPKGRQADSELTLARRAWHIRAVRIPSLTDPEATILRLSEVHPRNDAICREPRPERADPRHREPERRRR